MSQIVPTGTWTHLDGYDLEVRHDAGQNLAVHIIDSAIVTMPIDIECTLRPVGGAYPAGFRAPIRGMYAFGHSGGGWKISTTIALDFDKVVISDAQSFTNQSGETVYNGPEIGMNSGGPPRH